MKNLKTFALVDIAFKQGTRRITWLRKGRGNSFDTVYGGRFIWCSVTDKIIRRAKAYDFKDLDWHGTFLDNPEEKDGFLAPNGRWHGCPFESHSDCAQFVFGCSTTKLEERGYVHISGGEAFEPDEKLTLPQIDWLLENGYRDYVEDMEKEFGSTPKPEVAPVSVRKPSRLEREGD